MKQRFRKLPKVLMALVVGIATLFTGAVTAHADSGPGLVHGYYVSPISMGHHFINSRGAAVGIVAMDGGNPVYCIQFGEPLAGYGEWQDATSPDQRIAANLVDRNKSDMSDFTQAAVAWAIHDHLNLNINNSTDFWNYWKANGSLDGADKNAVGARAAQLWDEAAKNMPASAQMSYKYTQGKRRGTVNPGLKNGYGRWIAEVQYTFTDLNNKIRFGETGTNTISGVTNGQEEHIAWTAIGNGITNVQIRWKVPLGAINNSPEQKNLPAKIRIHKHSI